MRAVEKPHNPASSISGALSASAPRGRVGHRVHRRPHRRRYPYGRGRPNVQTIRGAIAASILRKGASLIEEHLEIIRSYLKHPEEMRCCPKGN